MTRKRMNAQKRKMQIKSIAMDIFRKKGFAATTMEDIADQSGLSKGGLYHHYANKEDIFYDLMKDSMQYRKKVVLHYMQSHTEMNRDDLILNMLLDKIMDKNPYKSVYSIFLTELYSNPRMTALYHNIIESSSRDFIEFCKINQLSEYIPLTNDTFAFFINAMIVALDKIKCPDEKALRQMLRTMLKAYLQENANNS